MTYLSSTGMDFFGATSNLIRFFNTVEGTNVTWGATSGRFGGGGITVDDADKYFSKAILGSPQTAVISFAVFRSNIAAVGGDTVWRLDNSSAGNGLQFRSNAASANITVFRGTTFDLGSFAIGLNAWHWVSIKAKMEDPNGTVDIEVDGVNVFSFAGRTVQTGTNTADNFLFGADQLQDFIYDDIFITDIAGGAPFNDILSDRRIDSLFPDAVGDSAGFTAVPAVDNHLNVDDVVPDDDTTYVEAEPSTTKDLYNFASMGFSPSVIDAVNVVALARNPDAGGTQLQLKVKSGVTEGTGGAQSPTTAYRYLSELFPTNPDTAAAWTESEVNGMQAGQEIV